jgi:hypothetical protein
MGMTQAKKSKPKNDTFGRYAGLLLHATTIHSADVQDRDGGNVRITAKVLWCSNVLGSSKEPSPG